MRVELYIASAARAFNNALVDLLDAERADIDFAWSGDPRVNVPSGGGAWIQSWPRRIFGGRASPQRGASPGPRTDRAFLDDAARIAGPGSDVQSADGSEAKSSSP